jgi:hypothetical protein
MAFAEPRALGVPIVHQIGEQDPSLAHHAPNPLHPFDVADGLHRECTLIGRVRD